MLNNNLLFKPMYFVNYSLKYKENIQLEMLFNCINKKPCDLNTFFLTGPKSVLAIFSCIAFDKQTKLLAWKQSSSNRQNICYHFSPSGSFTTRVRLKLVELAPFGTTISYKALSTAAGNSKASQAVGQAMANNPISLVVPCHRVIRSDGALGNYAHGRRNSVKQWLLRFERGEV